MSFLEPGLQRLLVSEMAETSCSSGSSVTDMVKLFDEAAACQCVVASIDGHHVTIDLKQTPGIIAQLVSNCVCRLSISSRGSDPNCTDEFSYLLSIIVRANVRVVISTVKLFDEVLPSVLVASTVMSWLVAS